MKKNIWVSPDERGWKVQRGGGNTISEHHKKEPAIATAVRQAKKDNVEVIIQNRDGIIVSKDSYGNESKTIDKEH